MKMSNDKLIREILKIGDKIQSQENNGTSFPYFAIYERYPVPANEDYSGSNFGNYYIWLEHKSGDYSSLDDNIEAMREQVLNMLEEGELAEYTNLAHITKHHIIIEATYDELSEILEECEYEKTYMYDELHLEAVFFTRDAANNYLEVNAHNLKRPLLYTHSFYNNREMQIVREFLIRFRTMFGHLITCDEKKEEV